MKIESSLIRDKFEFTDHEGNILKEVPFTINITEAADRLTSARDELAKVAASDNTADLKSSAARLFECIFGPAVAGEILDYYADDSSAMMIDLAPYLLDRVFPQIDKVRETALEMKKRVKRG